MDREMEFEREPSYEEEVREFGRLQAMKELSIDPKDVPLQKDINPIPGRGHADVVYFFIEGQDFGIKMYDQSPDEIEGMMTGTLPEGKYFSSGMEIVEWNEEENDKTGDKRLVREKGGTSFSIQTIMVSPETFLKIGAQGAFKNYSKSDLHRSHFTVDLNISDEQLLEQVMSVREFTPKDDKFYAAVEEIHRGAVVKTDESTISTGTKK